MPLSSRKIVQEIDDRFKQKRINSGTMLWKDFYKLAQMERMHEDRFKEIKKIALDDFGLCIANGNDVITVTLDRNYEPL